jgi:hypothetical protein
MCVYVSTGGDGRHGGLWRGRGNRKAVPMAQICRVGVPVVQKPIINLERRQVGKHKRPLLVGDDVPEAAVGGGGDLGVGEQGRRGWTFL